MAAKDHFSDEFVSDEFGIKFSNKMTTVEARVLPTPAVMELPCTMIRLF